MKAQLAISLYALFVVSHALPSSQVETATPDIVAASYPENAQNVHELVELAYPLQSPNVTNITATASKPTPAVLKPAVLAQYAYRGCYEDAVNSRILKNGYFYGDDITAAKCAASCQGSKYIGTEYGGECYCGELFPASAPARPEAECNIPCKGSANKTEVCGGANRLTAYWKIP
jgi:hypothetical protein